MERVVDFVSKVVWIEDLIFKKNSTGYSIQGNRLTIRDIEDEGLCNHYQKITVKIEVR